MTVIIDIDNTLSLSDRRFKLAKKPDGKTNWDIAHNPKLVIEDKPNLPMIDLARKYKSENIKVVILTGRPDTIEEVTKEWLKKYQIEYDELYMRSKKDHFLKANIFKKKIYQEFIKENVLCAFDDEEEIIQMWNSLGVPAFKVYPIQ